MSHLLTTGIFNQRVATISYLLDTYTAAVAFTLRQIKTSQGDVARVRRSSDSVEESFTATEISDGTLTTHTGASSGFISKLICAQGTGREVIQTTASIQPRIVNAGTLETENGKAAIQSVTSNELENAITSLNLNNTDGFMIFIVNKPTSIASGNRFISMSTGGNDYQTGGLNLTTAGAKVDNNVIGTTSVTNNLYAVNKFICVPSGNTYTTQNATTVNTASTPTFNLDMVNIAILNEIGFNRSYFLGKWQELLIFNYYNATDMAAIENDIKQYYGITY